MANKKPKWHKQVNITTRRMRQLMRDIRADVARRTRNSQDLDAWMENLAPYIASNPFIIGTYAAAANEIAKLIASTIDRTSLPPGSNAELMKGTMAEACMTMVTNVGEDMKTELRNETSDSEATRFSIDDYEHLPPYHPNCRCVPLFWPEPLEEEK